MDVIVKGEILYRDIMTIGFIPEGEKRIVTIPCDYVAVVEDIGGTTIHLSEGLASKLQLKGKEVV